MPQLEKILVLGYTFFHILGAMAPEATLKQCHIALIPGDGAGGLQWSSDPTWFQLMVKELII